MTEERRDGKLASAPAKADPPLGSGPRGKAEARAARAERLAVALRANLRRRKGAAPTAAADRAAEDKPRRL